MNIIFEGFKLPLIDLLLRLSKLLSTYVYNTIQDDINFNGKFRDLIAIKMYIYFAFNPL